MTRSSPIPRDRAFDSTLSLLSEGYEFIPSRARRLGSDIFETRLMLRPAVCITGEEAVRVFYEPDRFTRRGAIPVTALKLLQDRGSVQTLDGEAHRRRKAMFMSLMSPEAVGRLMRLVETDWRNQIPRWQGMEAIVLGAEVQAILCRAVCRWAGLDLSPSDEAARTRELAAMVEGAGSVGPRNWKGMLLRTRTERWARGIVDAVRARDLVVPEGSATHLIAWYRDQNGRPLDTDAAAVELLNVLRPTVAVARYVTFAALALHEHPEDRRALEGAPDRVDDEALEAFVQEVRRFYPFFPLVGGRVLTPFEWRGHRFERDAWVLLDLYGTLHDERLWRDAGSFRPERFRGRKPTAFDLVPQGAGEHHAGHRCAGEWITIAVMKTALRLLTGAMRYTVPEQDLRIDLSRMPAAPASGFIIRDVAPSAGADREDRSAGGAPPRFPPTDAGTAAAVGGDGIDAPRDARKGGQS
ncbi:cytochrome P450 [Arenibaculum sp.]|jgi:fatty-acid peroxygenase|uniref:cytochrome P450 n=1 Tax=Arenibaculum sp. TaxID=2865862 RepID=UPI002E12C7BD|nr:cytochrome P450 [Arenibaculum sp.]